MMQLIINVTKKIKSHLKEGINRRCKALASRSKHDPTLVFFKVKGVLEPLEDRTLAGELEAARKRLTKLAHKHMQGKVTEKTLKHAEYAYLKLVKKEKLTTDRRKGSQQSVEYWEGFIQALQIARDLLEQAVARMRRAV